MVRLLGGLSLFFVTGYCTHNIHVCFVLPIHLVDFHGKCREIYQSHGWFEVYNNHALVQSPKSGWCISRWLGLPLYQIPEPKPWP